MKLADRKTLLFIGDSITDCGRAYPVGESAGLGDGYVSFIDSLLPAFYPKRRIRVLNTGIGGDRIIDLEARWQTDVLDLKPNWLSVMIGINDVWQQFTLNPNQVMIECYKATYRNLLEQTRPKLDGLVLMSPYFIESNLSDSMRKRMDMYGKVVEHLSAEFDAIFVDTQAAFDSFILHRSSHTFCTDRIHPDKIGHMIIAKSFLTAIGFDWELANKSEPGDT